MKRFVWKPGKPEILLAERGIKTADVEQAIADNLITTKKNPSPKYPNQKVFIIKLNNYTHFVPFLEFEDYIELQTTVPSRKLHKIYGGKS